MAAPGSRPDRPPAYTDENVRRTVVDLLRQRGFSVATAREAGLLGQTDPVHLAHAAAIGRVLLTHDRGDYRRLHAEYVALRREHGGIILLPQAGPAERLAIRAAMLLDWWAVEHARQMHLAIWNDLQRRLHAGERLPGYSEHEVRLALGLAEVETP